MKKVSPVEAHLIDGHTISSYVALRSSEVSPVEAHLIDGHYKNQPFIFGVTCITG